MEGETDRQTDRESETRGIVIDGELGLPILEVSVCYSIPNC